MKYYTNKEIREFISCPQFGDIKYGKWGSQKLEIRETLLHLITINEEMDKMLKDRLLRIDKALEYLKRLQEKELITEFETGWLIELLEGDEE